MKAIICTKYGPPEVLQLRELEKPSPKSNEVLIKIHATAVTASDCIVRGFKMPGDPGFIKQIFMQIMMKVFLGFKKPRNPILGIALSGEIELLGKNINNFKRGDKVYGFSAPGFGTYAEYKCMSEKEILKGALALKPGNISHEEAAAISYGGILAVDFMKDMNVQSGNKVLIYGASGAIGTIAIQLAKYYGAQVTGVSGPSNADLIKSLGADKTIDYTRDDAINQLETYDFILDAVGKNKSSALKIQCKKALNPGGKYVSVDDRYGKIRPEFFQQLNTVIEADQLKAVIDNQYPLERIVEAHHYVDKRHKKGNVVITI